jgi:hypothetical protein
MPWVLRDIKLCAQKVKLCAQKVGPRGSRSWASISVGCSDGTHHGQKLWSAVELMDWR